MKEIINVTIESIIKQIPSEDLISELISREKSKEGLELMTFGFLFKMLGYSDAHIEEIQKIQKDAIRLKAVEDHTGTKATIIK